MNQSSVSRRAFLNQTAAATAGGWFVTRAMQLAAAEAARTLHLACNEYPGERFTDAKGVVFARTWMPLSVMLQPPVSMGSNR